MASSDDDAAAMAGADLGTMDNQISDAPEDIMTLNEPVWHTVKRDLRRIGIKLRYVLVPTEGGESDTLRELRDWDLWGPLLLCIVLATHLSFTAPPGQGSLIFTAVFCIVWIGAAVVTLNAQLLGGKISFFQSVCVLGYCIFPLNVAALICVAWTNVVFRAIVLSVGYLWSTRASVVFMSQMVKQERKILAVYPVLLFYIVLTWMIFSQ